MPGGKMLRRKRIYPVFLAHAGCPFRCVYCNQRMVTSRAAAAPVGAGVISQFQAQFGRLLEDAREQGIPGELAFYGGTFTALPPAIIGEILETVTPWVGAGIFGGLRFSTRPDHISEEVCSRLRRYPIETVELGVQSLVDEVLRESRRGYSSERVKAAVALIRRQGWRLGLQLMLGLPGDSPTRFLETVAGALTLQPDFVRIYPTLVVTGTVLAEWYRNGSYVPLSLSEAVSWCVPAYEAFLQANIPIVRLGLHPDPELEKAGTVVAGPYHPAFGYLVRVEWWKMRIDRYLARRQGEVAGKAMTIRVAARFLSEVIGPARSNVRHWQARWRLAALAVKGRADRLDGEFECLLN